MVEKTIALDWRSLVLMTMLFFGIIGWRNGWQKGLATLVSLFFAWGVAQQTLNFLVRAFEFILEVDLGDRAVGFFEILLYVATAIMVIVTFNSRIIPGRVFDTRDKASGLSTGLLNGYFFIVLLLDLGQDWIAAHGKNAHLDLSGNLIVNGLFGNAKVIVDFTNNPIEVYNELVRVQNLILLFILLVFWHGMLFWLLGRADRTLRPTACR